MSDRKSTIKAMFIVLNVLFSLIEDSGLSLT